MAAPFENYAVYRLALANLGVAGLGTVIYSNVLNTSGVEPGTDQLKFSRVLNGPGHLEFTIPTDTAGMPSLDPVVACGTKEVHLYRSLNGGAETLVWAGRLWSVDMDRIWSRFYCEGWYSSLRFREISTDAYFEDTEQFDIAWSVINTTQLESNGALGITRGAESPTATLRSGLWCAEQRTNAAQVIEDLAAARDGFDFEITPGKVWTVKAPYKSTDRTGTVILDAATNIETLGNYVIDAAGIRNDIAVIGKVVECEDINFFRATDATSQTAYGLLQGNINLSDMTDKKWMKKIGEETLNIVRTFRWPLRVGINSAVTSLDPFGDFDTGDKIRVKASYGWATFDKSMRVTGWTCYANNVSERFELDLEEWVLT